MNTYDLFRRAALEGKQLAFTYKGHRRLTCPHVIGQKNGMQKALVFQFGGGSSKGLPPGGEWRCLFISEVTEVELLNGEWKTGHGHSQPQTCVDQIDVQVFVGDDGRPYAKVA
jgi:hypothetical protein